MSVSTPLKLCCLLRSTERSFGSPDPVTTAPVTPIPIPEFSMNENIVSFVILLDGSLVFTCPILSLSAKLTAALGSSSSLSTLT